MVTLVVVGDEIVDCLHQAAQRLAVVLTLQKKLLLGKYGQKVQQALAAILAQAFRVWGQIAQDSDNRLVNRPEQPGS